MTRQREKFIQKLKENKPIQELATNPLLLTLLCLVFGEAGNFPVNRSELYKEGLDVLLKKWDAKRNIERDQVYKNLSLHRKEDLLSQIALTTFDQKDYFFKQKTVEAYIADFIRNLRDARTEVKELELDSEAVLKSIEGQHGLLVERAKGIYSFSHLTFQEYFAAREIVANSAWEKLVEHISEKRWREVFLLTAGMMRKADDLLLLMKRKIDELMAEDEKLQQFLEWVHQKANSICSSYKLASVRASYLGLSEAISSCMFSYSNFPENFFVYSILFLSIEVKNDKIFMKTEMYIDNILLLLLYMSFDVTSIYKILSCILQNTKLKLNNEFQQLVQDVQKKLPSLDEDDQVLQDWVIYDRDVWIEQLRTVMIEHRNIGHDWQFSDTQKQVLKQYYDANKLLVDCLNSDCYVSREVRQEIEETLLLPMVEIEKRQK